MQSDVFACTLSSLEPKKDRRGEKKPTPERHERDKPEGILGPAAVGFGSGYILEYRTGTLAVTKPRELHVEGGETDLRASGGHNGGRFPEPNGHFDF